MEKLQAVGMGQQLHYVVFCGVLFVFEVRWGIRISCAEECC